MYWPPARGYIAPSSAQDRAPPSVTKPPPSQTSRSHPGDDTYSRIYPVVMKIPDPITAPMTRKVVSRRLSRLRSCGFPSLELRSGGLARTGIFSFPALYQREINESTENPEIVLTSVRELT